MWPLLAFILRFYIFTKNRYMKKLVLGFALGLLLVGCNSKTITKKDLVGSYDAAIGYDTVQAQQQSPEEYKSFLEFMSTLKISYKFNEDGSGVNGMQVGEKSDQRNITWSLPVADTIKISSEGRDQVFHIRKSEKGFVLDGPEKTQLILTRKQ